MSYFRSRNILLVLAFLLALLLAAVVVWRYRPEPPLQTLLEALPDGVDLALQNIDYTHIEEGRARWRLVAQQVEHQSNAGVLIVTSPQLSFFAEDGSASGDMTADKGEVSNDYSLVKLRGKVVLQSAEGQVFRTEAIDYDHHTQRATTDAPVRMSGDGFELNGEGMIFELDSRRLTLLSEVQGVLSRRQVD